jgi:hypothetical protein
MMGLLLSACGGQVSEVFDEVNQGLSPGAESADMPAMEAPAAMPPEAPGADYLANTQSQQQMERLIIKNADLSLEVQDVPTAERAITEQAAELGGYVVRVQTSGTDKDLRTTITFRVPAERFEEALERVQGLGTRVLSRIVSGDDVTEEFVDLEARLRNLTATRDQLLDLLNRADRVEDALQVNRELSNIQGQIEQVSGRIKYLQQSAALSTVTVSLQPVDTAPIVDEGSWQPLVVASGALRSLVWLIQSFSYMLIVLLVWTPVWLPVLLLGRWLWLRSRTRSQGKSTTPTTGAPS